MTALVGAGVHLRMLYPDRAKAMRGELCDDHPKDAWLSLERVLPGSPVDLLRVIDRARTRTAACAASDMKQPLAGRAGTILSQHCPPTVEPNAPAVGAFGP